MRQNRFLVALTVLVASGCTPPGDNREQAAVQVNRVAAVMVNGEPIALGEVELEAVAQGIIDAGEVFTPIHPEFENVLEQLIDQRLLAQEAKRLNLDQSEGARHRLAIARERIMGNLLVESLVAQNVTEDAIQNMYAEQVALQQLDDEVQIRHILTDTREEAVAVRAEILDGGDFSALAFEHSRDTASRLRGGELGYVSPNEMDEPFSSIIGNTSVGEISDVFESQRGWHVLKVEDRRQRAPQTLEEMRPDLVSFLTFSQISETLRRLRDRAEITSPTGIVGPTAPVTEEPPLDTETP